MNRRRFLATLGTAATLSFFPSGPLNLLADNQPDSCDPPKPPGEPKPIQFDSRPVMPRKSIFEMDDGEIKRLRAAYAAMRALTQKDPSDPRGWMQQASIHCYYCGGAFEDSPVLDIHGTWYFFPWHRCYLYIHERILATLIGDPTFRLAYWDWDTFPAGNHNARKRLPPPFVDAADNSLYDAYRGVTKDDFMPDLVVGPDVMDIVMGTHGTEGFMGGPGNPGILEQAPHGAVHLWTGTAYPRRNPKLGPKGCNYADKKGGESVYHPMDCQDMGVLATAAQDPVFFAHHTNIDRLWDVWLNAPGNEGNPKDTNWSTQKWNFYDENKQWVSISVQDVLDHEKTLRYSYQPPQARREKALLMAAPAPQQPPQVPSAKPKPLMIASDPQGIALGTKPQTKEVALPPEHRQNLKLFAAGTPERYILHIDGITVPANEGTMVRVFLNETHASPATKADRTHFVGYFTIVAAGSHTHQITRNEEFELRPSVARTLANASKISVTLIPVTVDGKEPDHSDLKYKSIYLEVK